MSCGTCNYGSILQVNVGHVSGSEGKPKTALSANKTLLKSLSLTSNSVVKLTTKRITSFALHPCDVRPLVAGGDHSGNLGLWDTVSNACCCSQYCMKHTLYCSSTCVFVHVAINVGRLVCFQKQHI